MLPFKNKISRVGGFFLSRRAERSKVTQKGYMFEELWVGLDNSFRRQKDYEDNDVTTKRPKH